MRKMSEERRKLAQRAGVLAAMGGTMPVLMRHNSRGMWVWAAAMLVAEAWLVVKMYRLRREEGCRCW